MWTGIGGKGKLYDDENSFLADLDMQITTIEKATETLYSAYTKKQQGELFLVDAFLRALGRSKQDIASIKPVDVDSDPPDVLFHTSGRLLGVEVTRWIPWDRGNLVRREQIVKNLQERVRRRCIQAHAKANFYVVAQEGAGQDEIDRATNSLVTFLTTHDVSQENRILRVHHETFDLTYVPAQGSFRSKGRYENNIRIVDITGHDITDRWKRLLQVIEEKTLERHQQTDILLISGPPLTEEEFQKLHCILEKAALPHTGVYFLFVIRDQYGNTKAGVNIIRHHPLLKN